MSRLKVLFSVLITAVEVFVEAFWQQKDKYRNYNAMEVCTNACDPTQKWFWVPKSKANDTKFWWTTIQCLDNYVKVLDYWKKN